MIGINNNNKQKTTTVNTQRMRQSKSIQKWKHRPLPERVSEKKGLEDSWFLARGLLIQEILQIETSACSESELVFGYGYIYTETLYEGKQTLVLKESWFLAYVDTGMESFQKTYSLSGKRAGACSGGYIQ